MMVKLLLVISTAALVLSVRELTVLEPAAYGGCKDVSEAWAAGVLAVGEKLGREQPEKLRELWEERMAIMVYDGKLPPAEVARLAWVAR